MKQEALTRNIRDIYAHDAARNRDGNEGDVAIDYIFLSLGRQDGQVESIDDANMACALGKRPCACPSGGALLHPITVGAK